MTKKTDEQNKVEEIKKDKNTPNEAEVLFEAEENKKERDAADETNTFVYMKDSEGNVRQFIKGVLRARPCLSDNMTETTRKEYLEYMKKKK